MSPFAGAEDLNDEPAIEADGVLFMEGEGEPAEIGRMKREPARAAEDSEETGAHRLLPEVRFGHA